MCDCVAIILAGGQSLLQYAMTGSVGLDATTFSVVVGYEAKSFRRLLQPPNMQIIGNPYHRIEHMTAFLASLRQAPAARNYPVCPSNMPALVVQHLDHLPAAHLASDQKKSIPMRVDQHGNPIVLPNVCVDDILANPGHISCRGFTSKNPNRLHVFDTEHLAFFEILISRKIRHVGKNKSSPKKLCGYVKLVWNPSQPTMLGE